MQDAPDRQTLLAGVAMFLAGQVEPALKAPGAHPGLAFRSRIAAHLVATVGRELAFEEQHDAAELDRLRALLGSEPDSPLPDPALTGEPRREAIRALRAALAAKLRADEPIDDTATRAALMATLRDQLQVVQPRFDTRVELPEEP
ncbi:MAG: hypothetical protein H6701_05375 [Myxococcales bacterium]|nr:hypothetical protein [Myxococcales bacterium]